METIRVISPSDKSTKVKEWWGDHWVKVDLEEEFEKRGYEIVQQDADIEIFLSGKFYWENQSKARRFCWLYSHPGLVLRKREHWLRLGKKLEHIFVLSKSYVNVIRRDFKNSSVLLGGTSKVYKPRDKECKYDVLFVGNTGKLQRIEVLKYLAESGKYTIGLVGARWDKILGATINKLDWLGSYFDNRKLGDLFNQSRLSFYVTDEGMRRNGFVAVRILDVFCSSDCLMIPDENKGLKDIFDCNILPTFGTKEELEERLDWYLEHPVEADNDAYELRQMAQKFTFERVVDQIENEIKKGDCNGRNDCSR